MLFNFLISFISFVLLLVLCVSVVSAVNNMITTETEVSIEWDGGDVGDRYISVHDANNEKYVRASKSDMSDGDKNRFELVGVTRAAGQRIYSGDKITIKSVFNENTLYAEQNGDLNPFGNDPNDWIRANVPDSSYISQVKIVKADGTSGVIRCGDKVYFVAHDNENYYWNVQPVKVGGFLGIGAETHYRIAADGSANGFYIKNEDGECIEDVELCEDSDGGKDYGTKGTVTGEGFVKDRVDTCALDKIGTIADSGDYLVEYYCAKEMYLGSYSRTEIVFCNNSCVDGACVGEGGTGGDGGDGEPEQDELDASCEDEDGNVINKQLIMRLTDLVNAHGEKYNSDASVYLCYGDIFNQGYDGEEVHKCKDDLSNLVVKLDSFEQGHGYIPESVTEGLRNICYGDLICRSTEGRCDAGETAVLRLSAEENAHLALKGSGSGYDYRICCSSPSAGNIVTECGEGEVLCTPSSGAAYCTDAEEGCDEDDYNCNDDDICDENENCQCADCHGYVDSCVDELVCNFLDNKCSVCPDDNPFDAELGYCAPDNGISIEIISPSELQEFKVGEEINFEVEIESLKKDVGVTWTFADGSDDEIISDCLTSDEGCDVTHSFEKSGSYVVKVKAKEQGGIREDSAYVNILVYDEEINVFAIITKPEKGAEIIGKTKVKFDASESFVANCTTDSDECDASSLAEDGSDCYGVGDLFCYNFNTDNLGDTYELKFEWVFDNDREQYRKTMWGTWTDNYNDVVEFTRAFFSPDLHTADLKVTYGYYVDDGEDDEETEEDDEEVTSLEPPCGDYGDANDDEVITSDDSDLITDYLDGLIDDDEINLDNADVNGDGEIDGIDVRHIKKYLEGSRETFNVCDELCETLWWYDDDSTECLEEEFCGDYMYESLRTFDDETACENALADEGSEE